MKKAIALVAMLTTTHVFGASMEVCRPYAAQTAEMLMKYVWLRAYSSCLNSDEDPAAPMSQATLFELLPPAPGSVPATEAPKTAPKKAEFDPALVAECKRYYRTYKEDGTVIRRGSRKRVLCPQLTQN